MDFDNFVCCLVRLETMFRECPRGRPLPMRVSEWSWGATQAECQEMRSREGTLEGALGQQVEVEGEAGGAAGPRTRVSPSPPPIIS